METKKIKILTNGAIRAKGFINGPVLTPYRESLDTIFALVSSGVNVVEVLDDGREVKLTTANFSTDNNDAKKENVQKNEKVVPNAEAKPAEVHETKSVTEPVVTDEVAYNNKSYNHHKNKKRK